MFKKLISFFHSRYAEPTKESPYVKPRGDLWWDLTLIAGSV